MNTRIENLRWWETIVGIWKYTTKEIKGFNGNLIVLILGVIGLRILCIFTIVLTSILFLMKDMVSSTFSSWKSTKALMYGLALAMIVPRVFPDINWDYFSSKVTGSEDILVDSDPTACVNDYHMERYAPTSDQHIPTIKKFLDGMGYRNTPEKMQEYINTHATGKFQPPPVTGQMVWDYSRKHKVDGRLMLAIMHIESHFGTASNKAGEKSRAIKTKNPGNVGNYDNGVNKYYKNTWEEGVELLAKWLKKNRRIAEVFTHKQKGRAQLRSAFFIILIAYI